MLSVMDEQRKSSNNVSLLPLELQVNIFKMLTTREKNRCALVCKEWNNAVNMLPVWRNYTFDVMTFTNLKNCRILCESLATRDIRRVRMVTWNKLGETVFLYEVAQCIPNLVYLEIWYTPATDEMLESISRNLSKLVHLRLSNCNDVTDVGIGHLTGQGGDVTYDYPRLEFLNLGSCRKLTDTAFQNISNGQPQLKSLRLSSATLLSNSGLKSLSTMVNLEELFLNGETKNIRGKGLRHLATLTHLQVLEIVFQKKLTGKGIRHLRKMVQLRHLVLHSLDLHDVDTNSILTAIPDIHSLSIRGTTIDNLGLEIFCRSHLQIIKLEITDNMSSFDHFTDEGLKSIALLSELQELSLKVCCKIYGSGLAYIAEGNTKLTSLDLSGSYRVPSELAIEHIVKMKQLRTFIWRDHVRLSKDELLFLSKRLPLMKVIEGYYS